ncbi:MAG: ATP-binding protein [Clostridiales bacterium]|nr:ATP-binding protein [Clostridiales bacterium]
MEELSLNVLDVAQNGIAAAATLMEISVTADSGEDSLVIEIKDNGRGMTPEQLESVEDPFFTTRTTRPVGLGVPLFKMAAEQSGGRFEIVSKQGTGTAVRAEFGLTHIDRVPLGDINSTIHTLVTFNPGIDFVYSYTADGAGFTLDTREFKEILEGVPLDNPEVSAYIKEYLIENMKEIGFEV